MLKICSLWRDLNSVEMESWGAKGELKYSSLNGHYEKLHDLIADWALQSFTELESVLDKDSGSAGSRPGPAGLIASAELPPLMGSTPAELSLSPPPSPARIPAALKGKAKAYQPAEPDPRYVQAAQTAPLTQARLTTQAALANAGPTDAGNERMQIAIEIHNRTVEQTKNNAALRKASRQRNMNVYGTKVKPRAPAIPRMVAVPELPPTLDLVPPEAPAPATKRIRRKPRAVVQDMAKVPARRKSTRARAGGARTAGGAAAKRKSGAPPKAASRKRVKASDRKRRQEPETEPEASDTQSDEDELEAQSSTVPPRTTRKRPRRSTDSSGSAVPAGASSQRPVSKRPRMEVVLNHITKSSSAKKAPPRPRMRILRGSRAEQYRDAQMALTRSATRAAPTSRRSARLANNRAEGDE